MGNPLEKLRKIKGRSWAEIRSRGEQAFSVYTEQIGLSGKLLSDEEFESLLIQAKVDKSQTTLWNLRKRFYENAEYSFFPAFREDSDIFDRYTEIFGQENSEILIEQADQIVKGRIDLLGYKDLKIGRKVNWHFEPVSDKEAPLRHWRTFDDLATDETGDKKVLWELNRHQHFFILGLAYGFTKDEKYAETFVKHLESWMEQNPPGMGINWVSSLEVSFRAISWIWAFNLFKNSENFTDELFQKGVKFLHRHARHIEKYLSTYYSPNTHLTGEALGLYYIGTQLPFFKRSKRWREIGANILFAELDRQIHSDGGYFEQSTWYHRYTTDFYTHFFILKSLNSEKSERFLHERLSTKLQQLMNFLMYITLPDGTIPLIGDDDGGYLLPHGISAPNDFRACLSNGAVLFERGDYKFIAEEFAEGSLWLLGEEGLETFEEISPHTPSHHSFAFEQSGHFVMRDGWANTDNYLLVDCGELGSLKGGHGHADALAINLAIAGRSFLVDSGTYTYHESIDLRNLFRTTIAHNTLSIDEESQSEPGGKFSWKTMAHAQLENWISEERFDFFEGSHNGYERLKGNPTHTRSILFIKSDYWIMRDYAETSGEHSYALNFHLDQRTKPKIKTMNNGDECIDSMTKNDIGIRIFTFGDNGDWEIEKGFLSPCYGVRQNVRFPRFISKGMGAQEFFTFMLPSEKDLFEPPQVVETETKYGRAFVIKFRDYKDVFVFADGSGLVRTEFFDTNFRFLWSRISEKELLPEEFVMIGGTRFNLGGVEIINYQNTLNFAVGRRLGNRLNFRTPDNILSVTLPDEYK